MRLSELVAGLRARRRRPEADPEVTGVEHDSRRVRPGDLFVALPGAALRRPRLRRRGGGGGSGGGRRPGAGRGGGYRPFPGWWRTIRALCSGRSPPASTATPTAS